MVRCSFSSKLERVCYDELAGDRVCSKTHFAPDPITAQNHQLTSLTDKVKFDASSKWSRRRNLLWTLFIVLLRSRTVCFRTQKLTHQLGYDIARTMPAKMITYRFF